MFVQPCFVCCTVYKLILMNGSLYIIFKLLFVFLQFGLTLLVAPIINPVSWVISMAMRFYVSELNVFATIIHVYWCYGFLFYPFYYISHKLLYLIAILTRYSIYVISVYYYLLNNIIC